MTISKDGFCRHLSCHQANIADRPPQTRHDWEGLVRNEDTRLEKPWFAQLHGEGNEAGGLTREPWNEEATPKAQAAGPLDPQSDWIDVSPRHWKARREQHAASCC